MKYTLEQQLDQAKERSVKRALKKKPKPKRLRPKPGLIIALLKKQKGLCACCGQDLFSSFNVDHIIPLSRGGTNKLSNLQLLTWRCNQLKGPLLPEEYAVKRRNIRDRHELQPWHHGPRFPVKTGTDIEK